MGWGVAALVLAIACTLGLYSKLDADFAAWMAKEDPDYWKGKVVWITGASSGIGEALARDLASKGAQLVLSARRVEELERVKDSLFGAHEAIVLPFDMVDEGYHQEALAKVLAKTGHVDMLVLNAGRTQRGSAWETDASTIRTIFDLNVFAVLSLTRVVLSHFLERKAGTFVVTSSFSGKQGRAEVADKGIKVIMSMPGPVVSEIGTNAIMEGGRSSIQSSLKRMPTQRCAELMANGISAGVEEQWIAEQPVLTFYYLNQYAPNLYRLWAKFMGPARVKVFKEGGDDYDVKLIIQRARKGDAE